MVPRVMYRANRDCATQPNIFARFESLCLALMIVLLLSGCEKPVQEHKETIYIFGTLVEIVIRDVEVSEARAAIARIDREFQRMQKDWHAWKPGELMRVNEAISQGRPIRVSPFLLPLLRQAKELAASSSNLFNPAIGALIAAWGFHADERPQGLPPKMNLVRDLVGARPVVADVTIEGDLISSSNPMVQFDFGGFAKGVALDRAVAMLHEAGIKNAIVNAGGDLNIMGSAGPRAWRVGIRHPVDWGLIASVDLDDDENIYTSGNYNRYLEHEGIKYSHIIDPRNGFPVRHIVSASVIHSQGSVADAAATALSVAGPENWHRIAQQMGIKFALLIDEQGTVYLNPAMLTRIEFSDESPRKIVISDAL